ncbi:hypothetical protein LO80_06835 [Candidatus Francisella endociliophora]|uniref:DAGKc domain-containing protein n=1 Tax=Candidatus Francisella endociliophora TaxID=653937 RepID=A0A097EQ85_9GAMM|nr:diacylglycerol kinase family protein [Francisella sp. FSC1006]AIT09706.1 hypothetical protein LO80_06835 [Francisella sp. FSC1006]
MSDSKIALVINISCKNYENNKEDLEMLANLVAYKTFPVEGKELPSTINKLSDYNIIVVAGGDGTIHTAVQNISDSQILGVFPGGTLNHFAKDAKLPLSYKDLAESLNKQQTKEVDLISVNGQKVINNLSLGFYPGLVKRREFWENKLNKFIAYMPAFIQQLIKHSDEKINISYEDHRIENRFHSLLISNNCYSVDFPSLFQRESLEQGKIGVYYLKSKTNKNDDPTWKIDSTTKLKINNDKKYLDVAIDGETTKLKTPLNIELLPKKLKVIC